MATNGGNLPARAPFILREGLAAPPGWPPDVAPGQIIRAGHINAIRDTVYAWPGDVDGQFHTLRNVNLVNATGVLADPTTTAGDLIARGIAGIGRLPIGAAGQVLTVDAAQPQGMRWAPLPPSGVSSVFGRQGAIVATAGDYTVAQITGAMADPTLARGDMLARGNSGMMRLPIGSDGQVLTADAAAAMGVKWGAPAVTTVFGRAGAVAPQAGDYTAMMVTNAVSTQGSYPDPPWIPNYSYSRLIGVPATFPPAAHTHSAAEIVSGVLSTARLGTGVADVNVYLRGDGTWAAAGGGGGGGVISVFGRAGTVIAQSGDYTAAMVTGAVTDPTTQTGDLIVRNNVNALTRLPIGANGQVLQTDTSLGVGMKWTTITGSVQTPWVTDHDAANFQLLNVRRVGVGVAVPNYGVDVLGDINYTGVLRVNGTPVSFGGAQSPWTQDIDGSNHTLGNVRSIGIGVAPPQSAPLQVASHTPGPAGSVAVQDLDANASGNPVLVVSGISSEGTRCWAVGNRGGATFGQGFYLWNDRNSDILIGTNSAERMRITAAGNVGIGTPTPGFYRLSVVGGRSVFAPSNETYSVGIRYADGSPLFWIGADLNGDCIFSEAGGVERMRVKGSGNVGIGTATPAGPLSLGYGANDATLRPWANMDQGCLAFYAAQNFPSTNSFQRVLDIVAGAGNAGGSIRFVTQQPGAAGATAMLINPAGNVGIGTVAPAFPLSLGVAAVARKLAVYDSGSDFFGFGVAAGVLRYDSGAGSDHVFVTSGGVERMRITAGGRVGIGVNPGAGVDTAPFTLYSSTNHPYNDGVGTFHIQQYNNGNFRLCAGMDGGFNGAYIQAIVYGGGGLPLTLNPAGGSVLVGTTSASFKFQVEGGRSTFVPASETYALGVRYAAGGPVFWQGADLNGDLIFSEAGGTERMRIRSDAGGVHIGPPGRPAYPLDVTGDCNISGTYRVNGAPLATGGGGVSVQINGGAAAGPFAFLNFQQAAGMSITGSIGGPGGNTMSVTFQNVSDARLKRNIEPLAGGLAIIEELRPKRAEWNGLANMREGQPVVSIVAQELREVIPDAVTPFRTKLRPEDETETELLGFDPMAIISHLILAVQQLSRRLKDLDGRESYSYDL